MRLLRRGLRIIADHDRDTPGPVLLPSLAGEDGMPLLLSEVTPRDLGVHPSRFGIEGDSPYIHRRADDLLADALTSNKNRLIIVEGPRLAGASRTLAQAAQVHLPDQLAAGFADDRRVPLADMITRSGRWAAATDGETPGVVLWLDRLSPGRFIELAQLPPEDLPTGVRILGTLDTGELDGSRIPEQLDKLLSQHALRVRLTAITDEERFDLRTQEVYAALRPVLDQQDDLFLGRLMVIWESLRTALTPDGSERATGRVALLRAVTDWYRVDVPRLLSQDVLSYLYRAYCGELSDTGPGRAVRAAGFRDALTWASAPPTIDRPRLIDLQDIDDRRRYAPHPLLAVIADDPEEDISWPVADALWSYADRFFSGEQRRDIGYRALALNAHVAAARLLSHADTIVDPGAYGKIAELFYERGEWARSREWLHQAISTGDTEQAPKAMVGFGDLEGDQGDPVQARRWYQQAIDTGHPDYAPRAMVGLGLLEMRQGDPVLARRHLHQAIDTGHRDWAPAGMVGLGDLEGDQGDPVQARRWYQQAIDTGHRDWAPAGMVGLGDLEREQGDPTQAQSWLHQAIDTGHPDHAPHAMLGLGLLELKRGDRVQAQRWFQQVIDTGHPDPAPHAMLGLGWHDLLEGNPIQARRWFQQAIETGHPDHAPGGMTGLGALEIKYGHPVQARRLLQQAIDTGHRDEAPRAMLNFAILEVRQGNPVQARHWYQQTIDTGHPEVVLRAQQELRALDQAEDERRRADWFGRYAYLAYADLDLMGKGEQTRFESARAEANPDKAIPPAPAVPTASAEERARANPLAALDEAEQTVREAVPDTIPDHSTGVASTLFSLMITLWAQFERTGAQADLAGAIWAAEEAVKATPDEDPSYAKILASLGDLLRIRFERTGAQSDLDESIAKQYQAAAAIPRDHPDRAHTLSRLGIALRIRFVHTGAQADLDEALQTAREAAEAAPHGHPSYGEVASSLANTLEASYKRTGAVADLDEAVRAAREAAATIPDEHPRHAGLLSNLGNMLQARFERTGMQADLDEAIATQREAVAGWPRDHPDRARSLINLANALHLQFQRTGALADLDEAVRTAREAAAATPDHHPNRAWRLSNLGGALQTRFERTGELTDLAEAIASFEEAVATTPDDQPRRAMYLNNLGVSLYARFERTGAQADLDQAVPVGQEAVAATPGNHPDRAVRLFNLGNALAARFQVTGEQDDLEEAIAKQYEAVAAVPHDHPNRATALFNLGRALQIRFGRSGAVSDLDKAVDAFGRAMKVEAAPPSVRIRGARAASELAARWRPGWATDLMEQAVRLLPQVAPRQLERRDQQYALGGLSGLAGDAAALVLAGTSRLPGERATLALQLLETGRAVLLSQALEVRSDLTDLTGEHPELGARFIRLRDLLDSTFHPVVASAAPTLRGQGDGAASEADRQAPNRRQLAAELADVVAEIRTKEGFGSFAQPPSTAELLKQAAAGPVVIFNVSQYRSDALLLTEDGIASLPLPGLARDTVIAQIDAFHQALHSSTRGKTSSERAAAQRQLNQILRWLWDTAAGPILDALGYLAQPSLGRPWPRLWWAPGGLMGLLPIHAAGHHGDPGGRAVMDRVISSYTPTITALHHARRSAPRPVGQSMTPQALIVAMPTTPGLPGRGQLGFVNEETRILADRLPDAIILTEPEPEPEPEPDPAADPAGAVDPESLPTLANVLSHLVTCPTAHFACHGTSDAADPSSSRLLLHDHQDAPLTVSALASVHLDDARLAYLSACDTALSANTQLIDEAIHLASAFQLAGYSYVVGTLWAIDDRAAVQISDAFYAAITNGPDPALGLNPTNAAAALHRAVRTIRDTLPATPSLWASHIHVGA